MRFFMCKQPFFLFKSTGISGQASVASDDPVTGNNHRDRIMSDRTSDCLRRDTFRAPFYCKDLCDLSISNGTSIWDFCDNLPYFFSEITSCRCKRKFFRIRILPCKIPIQPVLCLIQYRQVFLLLKIFYNLVHIVFLSFKP